MVRAVCGVQLNVRKSAADLMLLLGLNEAMDQLSMTICVC